MKELSNNELYVIYWSKSRPPFDSNKIKIILGNPLLNFNKPQCALWGSPVNAHFGWKEWCKCEKFGDYDWDNPIYFKLKANSSILKINIDDLKEEVLGKYVTNDKDFPFDSRFTYLDFNKMVKDGIDAVQLMDGRLGHYFMTNAYEFMFNTWDCESIVVLNKDVIKFV